MGLLNLKSREGHMKWSKLVPELSVSNFEESLRFYTETLGFNIVNQRSNPNFVYLSMNGIQIMLEETHSEMWETGKLERPFGRGVNFQMEVDDIAPIYSRLINEKYSFFKDKKESCYEVNGKEERQLEFLVMDPDGYLLRFIQSYNY